MNDNDKMIGKVKILLLGQSSVGKSSLLTQYCDQNYSLGHMPTIGIQYKQKIINLSNNKTMKVQLWDTAGHQRFRTITPVYYRNVDGVLLIFDITNQESFEAINYWINQLNEKADIDKIQMMLVGNKFDLQNQRQVKKKSALDIAQKIGISYCQTSAKSYDETLPAFDDLINKILATKKHQLNGGETIRISKTNFDKKPKKKSDCC